MNSCTEKEIRLGKTILDSAHIIKRHLNSMFEEENITGLQARIIGFVFRAGEKGVDIFQKDIEAEFKINRSSVTSVLNNLEKNGFIARRSVENDARLKKIILTEKALQFGENHKAKLDNFEKKLMGDLSYEEIHYIKTIINKIISNIEDVKEW